MSVCMWFHASRIWTYSICWDDDAINLLHVAHTSHNPVYNPVSFLNLDLAYEPSMGILGPMPSRKKIFQRPSTYSICVTTNELTINSKLPQNKLISYIVNEHSWPSVLPFSEIHPNVHKDQNAAAILSFNLLFRYSLASRTDSQHKGRNTTFRN